MDQKLKIINNKLIIVGKFSIKKKIKIYIPSDVMWFVLYTTVFSDRGIQTTKSPPKAAAILPFEDHPITFGALNQYKLLIKNFKKNYNNFNRTT